MVRPRSCLPSTSELVHKPVADTVDMLPDFLNSAKVDQSLRHSGVWIRLFQGTVRRSCLPQLGQFAVIRHACPRSTDPSNSRDSEGAGCWGHRLHSRFLSRRASQTPCGATAASLRNALSLGDCAHGMLGKNIPEGALDEVRAWGYADDEDAFTNILIFTDGSGTMMDSWRPQLPAP